MDYFYIPTSVNPSSSTQSSCSQNDSQPSFSRLQPVSPKSNYVSRCDVGMSSAVQNQRNLNDISPSSSSYSLTTGSIQKSHGSQMDTSPSIAVTQMSPRDLPPLPFGKASTLFPKQPKQLLPFIKEEAKDKISDNKVTSIMNICEKQVFDQSSYIQIILNICSQITSFPGFEPFCKQIISVCQQILSDTYRNSHEIIDICKNISNLDLNSKNNQNSSEKDTEKVEDITEEEDDEEEDEEFEDLEQSDSEEGMKKDSDPDWSIDENSDLKEQDNEMKNSSNKSPKIPAKNSEKDSPTPKISTRVKGKRKSRSKIGKGEYQCPECPRIFVNYKGFEKHQEHHKNGFKTTCEICGVLCPTPSHFKNHMRTHTGEKPFVCDVCGNSYAQISSLNSHLLSHSDERPIHCELCEYKCRTVKILKRHMVCHTNEKKYQCDNCGARFSRSGCLKKHLIIHTDEWPFPCDLCSKKFKNKVHLKRHEETHTDEYKFQCPVCGKRMRQSGNLRTHMRTHNGEKPYICEICGMAFAHNVTRKQHQSHCNGRIEVLLQ